MKQSTRLALATFSLGLLGAASSQASEARAQAAFQRVNLPGCLGTEVAGAIKKPSLKDRVALLKAKRALAKRPELNAAPSTFAPLKSPFATVGLGVQFAGRTGNPITILGQKYDWHISFNMTMAQTQGDRYQVGIFRKPDGSLWFGTAEYQKDTDPNPIIPNPCGLRRFSKVPRLEIRRDNNGIQVGEFDSQGRLHGFGVEQVPGNQTKTADYIGFFKNGKRHGWGVTSHPRVFSLKSIGNDPKVLKRKKMRSHWLYVGAYDQGAFVHGYRMIHNPFLKTNPLNLDTFKGLSFYAGALKGGHAQGHGVGFTNTWMFKGEYEASQPKAGQFLDLNSSRKEWHWAGKYQNEPRALNQTFFQLKAGDIVLVSKYLVPMAVAIAPTHGLAVLLESGRVLTAKDSFRVLTSAKLRSEGAQRLRAYKQTKSYQQSRASWDAAIQKSIQDQKTQAKYRAEQAAWNQANRPKPVPHTPLKTPYKYQTFGTGSTSTSNYETRRSDAIRREREYKRQLNRDINRIGKRY